MRRHQRSSNSEAADTSMVTMYSEPVDTSMVTMIIILAGS